MNSKLGAGKLFNKASIFIEGGEKTKAVNNSFLLVRNLSTYFYARKRVIKAVDEVTLEIEKGETVGIAGESGCGKSTLARSILRLVPPPGRIVSGEILYKGQSILIKMDEQQLRNIRGNKIAIIFQDPSTYLNPTVSIGKQICDVIMAHKNVSFENARSKTIQLLDELGIPEPEDRFRNFPHEFSGGMKQRVLIAMAISCDPELVIADEPTTALDVTIQRQILELMKEKLIKEDSSLLFITHDLSILAEICDRIYIMYAGSIIEQAKTTDLFQKPLHPYTQKLLTAIPRHDTRKELTEIRGFPPRLDNLPVGCSFYPRCDIYREKCHQERPPLHKIDEDHFVRCHNV